MRKLTSAIFLSLIIIVQAFAGDRQITLEDLWKDYRFNARSVSGVNWMKDGSFYSSLVTEKEASYVVKYDIVTGKAVDTLVNGRKLTADGTKGNGLRFSDYSLSADENQVMLTTESEQIYRRSSKAQFYIYDLKSKKLRKLAEGDKQSYATFSPDGSKVGYVSNNDLYYVSLDDMKPVRVTKDGKRNETINGSTDWVYEEEFAFAQAFFWSPDSKKIAFYKFDERKVPEYNMQEWGELYPSDYRFKYPKAGDANSVVSIHIYHLGDSKLVDVPLGDETDIYIPRINWTSNPDLLSVRRMNRLQNNLEIMHANATTGKVRTVYTEKNDSYIDIYDDLHYLSDGSGFIYSSEKGGFKHLYLYDMEGKQKRQITTGPWEVTEFVGLDEKKNEVYYVSTEASSIERQFYKIDLKGKKKVRLSQRKGTHSVNMSPDFSYYLNYYSSVDVPTIVTLNTAKDGKILKILEDNAKLMATLKDYDLGTKEFMMVKAEDGAEMNTYMIKPSDFDPKKEYPLLMFVYGGPGSQQVADAWGGANYIWFQMLAEKGYLVACVDNRGTGFKGEAFKKMTYGELGKLEVKDQIAGAKYFGGLSYVDKDRIGIWGWSYGGYMAALCITQGHDVFSMAISVAPVSNWRFYDTIYTERYLGLPKDNASGYDDNSPVMHAGKLEDPYLLIHGTGDDNVHFQNSVALADALISANRQFDSFYYPNRNHGIYGGSTRLHLYTKMTNFIEENL